jgi:AraC-like DNA-binding protein
VNPLSTDCRSEYREYRVPLSLHQHLVCLWTQSISGTHGVYSHTVLPDACVDVVFINHEAPLLVGAWQKSFIAEFPPGTQILGARFHPGRAAGPLRLPAFDLLNLYLPFRDVCGRSRSAQFAGVVDQPSLPRKRAALERVMAGWLSRSGPDASDGAMASAIGWLANHPGDQIDRLCQKMAISPRQLHRRFLATVGLGPKLFQSVVRFQRLLDLACSSPSVSLAGLAADAGYADQSHMTREVRRFSGKPPSVLLRSEACTLRMSELFKSGRATS